MGGVASNLGLGMAFSIGKGAICDPYSLPLGYLNYKNYITIN